MDIKLPTRDIIRDYHLADWKYENIMKQIQDFEKTLELLKTVEYDSIFPEYDFSSNKGYGTAVHISALKENGPTPIHRRSFIGNFVNE